MLVCNGGKYMFGKTYSFGAPIDISSVPKLCQLCLRLQLISSAIQRCRMSEDLCRLSVALRCFPDSVPPSVRISNIGAGSCLKEFKDMKYTREGVASERWDGVVSITTTGIGDNEIFNYQLNTKENNSTRMLTRLPSIPKNGAKISGTEVTLSTSPRALLTCWLR